MPAAQLNVCMECQSVLLCLLVINTYVSDLVSVCMKNERNCWLQYFLYHISDFILQFELTNKNLISFKKSLRKLQSTVEERLDLSNVFHLDVVREACIIVFCTVGSIYGLYEYVYIAQFSLEVLNSLAVSCRY
jgi:hypothetical protein